MKNVRATALRLIKAAAVFANVLGYVTRVIAHESLSRKAVISFLETLCFLPHHQWLDNCVCRKPMIVWNNGVELSFLWD